MLRLTFKTSWGSIISVSAAVVLLWGGNKSQEDSACSRPLVGEFPFIVFKIHNESEDTKT